MLSEFAVMRNLSVAQHDQSKLAELIIETDFTGLRYAQAMALDVLELTRANIQKNTAAARKVAGFDSASGIRAAYRLAVLQEMLLELDGSSR